MVDHGMRFNASRKLDLTAYEALSNVEREEKEMDVKNVFKGDMFFIDSQYSTPAPGIVVSSDTSRKSMSVVWLSQNPEDTAPSHVLVPCQGLSTAMCEKISTVNKSRLGQYIRSCTDEEMERIDAALVYALGLDIPASDAAKDEKIRQLQGELNEAGLVAEGLLRELAEVKKTADKGAAPEDIIKLTTERNTYKQLYEQLLEKMMG